jgi:hypothetical protein
MYGNSVSRQEKCEGEHNNPQGAVAWVPGGFGRGTRLQYDMISLSEYYASVWLPCPVGMRH